MDYEEWMSKLEDSPPDFETFWRELTACAWFGDMSEVERSKKGTQIREILQSDPSSIPYGLSATVLDVEWIEEPGDYREVVEMLAESSGGKFRPTNITDNVSFEGGSASVSFVNGGQSFTATMPFVNDWIQPEVFELCNQALAAEGVPERFMPMPSIGQDVPIAFTSPAAYRSAVEKDLIPATDPGDFEPESAEWLTYLRGLGPRPAEKATA